MNGNHAEGTADFSLFIVPVDTAPPGAPDAGRISATPPAGGLSTVVGLAGAVEAGAVVEVLDLATQAANTVAAGGDGSFLARVETVGGNLLRIVAIDATGNRSDPTTIPVPVPPTLVSIAVTPASVTLNRTTPSQQLTVTGTFSDTSQALLSSGVSFTSADPTVAAPTPGGLVQPVHNGTTSVHVEVAGVAPVDVPVAVAFPTIVSVSVFPASVHLLDVGRTQSLAVSALLSDNTTQAFSGTVGFRLRGLDGRSGGLVRRGDRNRRGIDQHCRCTCRIPAAHGASARRDGRGSSRSS